MISFADLIYPVSTDLFFNKYWEKAHLHLERKLDNHFDDILSVKDIDSFISSQNLMPDGLHVIREGQFTDSVKWTRNETLLDGTVRVVVCPEKLLDYFESGATIIINSAEKNIPKLSKSCIVFEQELNINIQANIYISPPRSKGFQLHYDPHDIFLMQIKGSKTWKIYDSGEELPTSYRSFRKNPKLIREMTIHPGDFFYMPRGTVHEAFSSEETSIHLNFSCKPIYGFHLLEEIAKIARKNDIFFRRTIPNKFASLQEQQSYIELFTNKTKGLVKDTSCEYLLQKQTEIFNEKQLTNFNGRFSNLIQFGELTLETSVVKRRNLSYTLETSADGTIVRFLSHKLVIPLFVEKKQFLGVDAFKIKHVSGLISNSGKLELVKQFLKAGYLEIMDNNTELNNL